jgi:pimeloyl-ACP methyl ester carboxylesterase
MTREQITFDSSGLACAGWFYPAAAPRPAATIVMAHGLAAVKEMRLDAYAERFAAAGYNVLVFDYRHFGGSAGQPRQILDIGKQHQDWEAAVEYARTRQDVNGTPIVLWGSSLSGGHVMAIAGRVGAAAVISQVPHASGPASTMALGGAKIVKLTGHAIIDAARSLAGMSPHYVPASGAPGTTALMTAPEASSYIDLVPPGHDFDQRVAARFALHIGFYSPANQLKKLTIPVLMQVGTKDETTPPAPAIRAARRAPTTTLIVHDTGHFEPYTGELFETFVSEQIDFLNQHFRPIAQPA